MGRNELVKRTALLVALLSIAFGAVWFLRAPGPAVQSSRAEVASGDRSADVVRTESAVKEVADGVPTPAPVGAVVEVATGDPASAAVPEVEEPPDHSPAKRLSRGKRTDGAITGTLVDSSSAPIADHDVWLTRAYDLDVSGPTDWYEVVAQQRTDVSGRFEFEELPFSYWHVWPSSKRTSSVPDGVTGSAVAVELTEAAPDVDVLLRAERGLNVAGRVLDSIDHAVEGAYVIATGGPRTHSTLTDASGAFDLGPFAPGRCSLFVHGLGGGGSWARSDAVEVEAGARDIVLRMNAAASLHGRVSSPSGTLHGQVLLTQSDGLRTYHAFANGAFAFGALAPGSYSLVVTTDDEIAIARDVLVGESGMHVVELALEPAARIRVSVGHGGRAARGLNAFLDGFLLAFESMDPGTQTTLVVPGGRIAVTLGVRNSNPVQHLVATTAGREFELSFD